jgi:hypothetical protein
MSIGNYRDLQQLQASGGSLSDFSKLPKYKPTSKEELQELCERGYRTLSTGNRSRDAIDLLRQIYQARIARSNAIIHKNFALTA